MKLSWFIQNRVTAMLLLCFAFNMICKAQLWNKTYADDRPVMYFSSVVYNDGKYEIAGGTRDKSGLNFTRAMVGHIDGTGNLESYKVVIDSAIKHYGAFYNAMIKDNKQQLCYAGYSYDSVPKLLLLLQNPANDSITVFEYSTPNTYAFQGLNLIQHTDNYYYVTGIRTTASTNDANAVLVKIDSAGNRLWEKYYGVANMLEATQSIIELHNGNLMLGNFRSYQNGSNTVFNTWLIEVDTTGELVREWFDPNDSTYVAEGLRQTQDGFIYGGQKKYIQIGNTIGYTGTITKLDTYFNKQWVFNSGYRSIYTGISDIEVLSDGNIIACGQKQIYNEDSTILSGWVVKLTPNGQVIWDRVYTGINTSSVKNFLSDIDVLPDGSLIAVGQCQHSGQTPPQVGWFLKLDSNGCEIENCVVGIEADHGLQTTDDGGIQVWPNPFSSDLSIALTGEHVTGATFTITNLMGQVVYQQTETNLATGYTKMLDLSYLPNGVYFVAVSTGDKTEVERVVKE